MESRNNEINYTMIILEPICFSCKHFNLEQSTCVAFNGDIPDEILSGENNHSTPLPNQTNNIVFEPKEKEDVFLINE